MMKSNVQWNAKQVAKMVQNGSLKFDNAVQRGFVWDKKRQTLLIDTILRGYPIPPMYTIKSDPVVNEKGKEVCTYDCLDGKQRCTTIAMYINDGFALGDMDYIAYDNGDEMDISGLLFSELDEELQDRILSYSLTVYFFTDITDDEISEMMARLNNGKSLTSYELSRVKAKDLATIQKLANHHLFDTISNKNYACEDIVVKSYVMLNDDQPCLDTKAIRPLLENLELTNEDTDQLEDCFDMIDKAKDIILSDETDEKLNRAIVKKFTSKTHLISLIPVVNAACKSKKKNIENILAEFIQDFYTGKPSKRDDYNEATKSGSNHTQNVKARNDALMEEWKRFLA